MKKKLCRDVAGVGIIALGLGFGLYCGFYLMLIGGVIDVGQAINGGGAILLFKGLAKMLFSGTVTAAIGMVVVSIGWRIRGTT